MKIDNTEALIQDITTQKIVVFLNNKFDQDKETDNLAAYTKKMTFKEFLDEMKDKAENPEPHVLKLTFEKCMDNRTNIDFLPIIYQEKSSINTHHFIVYDVFKMKIVRHCSLRGNLEIRELLRKDDNDFGCYTLTRTSDVFEQKHPFMASHSCNGEMSAQVVKYQVGTQFYLKHFVDENRGIHGINPASCTMELSEYEVHFSCCF